MEISAFGLAPARRPENGAGWFASKRSHRGLQGVLRWPVTASTMALNSMGRVASGLLPEAPTDPDVRNSRIRLFGPRLRYVLCRVQPNAGAVMAPGRLIGTDLRRIAAGEASVSCSALTLGYLKAAAGASLPPY